MQLGTGVVHLVVLRLHRLDNQDMGSHTAYAKTQVTMAKYFRTSR